MISFTVGSGWRYTRSHPPRWILADFISQKTSHLMERITLTRIPRMLFDRQWCTVSYPRASSHTLHTPYLTVSHSGDRTCLLCLFYVLQLIRSRTLIRTEWPLLVLYAGFAFFWIGQLVFPSIIFLMTMARALVLRKEGTIKGGILDVMLRDGELCVAWAIVYF